MGINTSWQGRRCTIKIEQEMNIYTASMLKEPLLEPLNNSRDLVLDLSGVADLDTSGVQLLLLLHRESIRHQINLSISQMSIAVRESLTLYGLLNWFNAPEIIAAEGNKA